MEKTVLAKSGNIVPLKHLHERGEDKAGKQQEAAFMETPPRAWRRPAEARYTAAKTGNTSTSVEKTGIMQDAIGKI